MERYRLRVRKNENLKLDVEKRVEDGPALLWLFHRSENYTTIVYLF